jgi:hypothetical protein
MKSVGALSNATKREVFTLKFNRLGGLLDAHAVEATRFARQLKALSVEAVFAFGAYLSCSTLPRLIILVYSGPSHLLNMSGAIARAAITAL